MSAVDAESAARPHGDVPVRVYGVRFEHHREALGIGERTPRISWKVATEIPGWTQTAYELEVDGEPLGRVESAESVLVPGAALAPRQRRTVRVRVWSGGDVSPWSAPAAVEAGIDDWSARMVAAPPGLLRREFDAARRGGIGAAVRHRARRLRARAQRRAGRRPRARARLDELPPPPALPDLRRHARCCAPGANALGAWLGEGWYRGRLGFRGGVGARLRRPHRRCSRSSRSPTPTAPPSASAPTASGARARARSSRPRCTTARATTRGGSVPGWSAPGFDDAGWAPVEEVAHDAARLVAPTGPPVRRTQLVEPVDHVTSPSGKTHRRLRPEPRRPAAHPRATARRGRRSRCATPRCWRTASCASARCAGARATDHYTLRGGGAEEWEPRFTFHGFRYAEVDRRARSSRSPPSSATPTWSARAGSSCSEPDRRTACTRTSSGACAATSSTSRPTARSATSGWAGPATSRCSRPPRPSSTTAPACSPRGCATSRPSRTSDGGVPLYVPFVELGFRAAAGRRARRRWPPGATPR